MHTLGLSLTEFIDLAKTAKHVVVFREINTDQLTPTGVYQNLQNNFGDGVLLETGLQKQGEAYHSYLAFDPIAQLQVENQRVSIKIGKKITEQHTKPLMALRSLMAELSVACKPSYAAQITQMAGFMSYDAIRLFEDIPDRHPINNIPEILFSFYRIALAFDHQLQKLLVSVVVAVNEDLTAIYQAAQQQIDQLIDHINQPNITQTFDLTSSVNAPSLVQSDIDDTEFAKLVERAKQYIVRGDAFQIVLSRCFKQRYTAASFTLYHALRKLSPSPYMFYLPFNDHVLVGASPERLIRVQEGKITVHAIAGTRPRTGDIADETIAADLLNDKKELAEHKMLVDLARNDVGSIAIPGSVVLEKFSQVQHYSHVSHITSMISGQLKPELDVFAAIAAVFPAGTLSGAPKISAMRIIDELETSRRDVYGGAICRLDFAGNLDSCIAIRMALIHEGIATIRTGAGIVYDSNPLAEAKETAQKARAMLAAIKLAQSGSL